MLTTSVFLCTVYCSSHIGIFELSFSSDIEVLSLTINSEQVVVVVDENKNLTMLTGNSCSNILK